MHGIWPQPRRQSRFPGFAEYRLANRAVVRQHADDDIAVEQIGNAELRLQAKAPDFRRTVGAANIGDHRAAAGREIGRHGAAHATQPDKADASIQRPALAMATVNRGVHVIVSGQYVAFRSVGANLRTLRSGWRGVALHPAFPSYRLKSLLCDCATRRRQGAMCHPRDIQQAPNHSPGGTAERSACLPENWWSTGDSPAGHSRAMIALQPKAGSP